MKKHLFLNFFIFCLSIFSFAQPTNDDCANAIPLTINTSCIYTTYDNLLATASADTDPSCASYSTGDVWFSFVVPAGGSVTANSNVGTITDSGMAWYTGICGALTEIACSDDESENGNMSMISQADLIPGETIFIRFWDYSDGTGTFDICVSEPPLPPSNDECLNSLVVNTNPDLNCTSFLSATIQSATASVEIDDCGVGSADDDVWFSFVATDVNHSINLNNIIGSTTDLYHSVYGGTCPSLGASLICSDPNSSTLTGLTIGNSYIVRVYTYSSTPLQTSSFDFCITTPPPPPANDECTGAVPLTVNSTCIYSTFSNESSTGSPEVDPGCASYSTSDVWFSFVVPASGNVTVNSNSGTITDSGMALYSGTCTSLVLLECDDDDSDNGSMSLITQNGLTPGETIFVRFWDYSDGTGTFDLCATETAVTDIDGDGFDSSTDCDDNDNTVYQNITVFIDSDMDNYDLGSILMCIGDTPPNGFSLTSLGTDCNDNDANINPGVVDIPENGIDEDCDGTDAIPTNQTPIVLDDNETTYSNQEVQINVVANDSDSDGTIDNNSLSVTNPPTNGTISIDFVTGIITYTPNLDYFGIDQFTYIICDNGTPSMCDDALVTIDVQNALPPSAINDDGGTIFINEENGYSFVLQNDTDPNGAITPLTHTVDLDLSQAGIQNTFTSTNPVVVWNYNVIFGSVSCNPDIDVSGIVSLDYEVCDPQGLCDIGTVTFNVIQNTASIIENSTSIAIYPNPVNHFLIIKTNNTEFLDYQIFNLDGKVLLSNSTFYDRIDVSLLNSGIYFLELKTKFDQILRFQFIKENL